MRRGKIICLQASRLVKVEYVVSNCGSAHHLDQTRAVFGAHPNARTTSEVYKIAVYFTDCDSYHFYNMACLILYSNLLPDNGETKETNKTWLCF